MHFPSLRLLLLTGVMLVLPGFVRAQPASADTRRSAACALAFGRLLVPSDTAVFPSANSPFADLLARARTQLAADPALQRDTAARAWRDAFGQPPADADLPPVTATPATYTELVARHLAALAADPAARRAVLDRAYRRVVHRPAFDEEIVYWQSQTDGALSYVLLVGCLEDWARRNQPGLMNTTGTPTVSANCAHLTTLRLAPALADEIRAATQLLPAGPPALAAAAGRNLIAPGGSRLVTAGGIHFIAIGASSATP